MKIISIDVLITTYLISFVSSENYSSASVSSPPSSSPSSPSSSLPSSPSSPALISALISSSEPSATVNNKQQNYNSYSSLPILTPHSEIKFNSFPSNIPRFLKRFELDLSKINNGQNHLLGSSLTNHNQHQTNPKPIELQLPKLLSIDLSILDKPLPLPMGYYGDFDDLSFPRDSRSNEIDDNLYLNLNHNQENGNIKNLATNTNSKSNSKTSAKEINYNSNDKSNFILPTNNGEMDYNGHYFDFNDDIPNEVPMDPVYFDDEQGDHSLMINDQVNSEQGNDYQPIFDHLPDHLSTGNDALSDYLAEIRSSNNHRVPYQHHHKHNHLQEVAQHQIVLPSPSTSQPFKSSSPYFVESVYQLAKSEPPKAISIVDLFKHFNHESSSKPINPMIPNWFHIGQPDLLMNTLQGSLLLPVKSETQPNQSNNQNLNQHLSQHLNQHLNQHFSQHPINQENQQQSYGVASQKGPAHLILDNSILNNQYHNVHHHQHQLPSSFSIQSLADVNHNKNDNNENNINDKSVQTLSNLAQLNHQANRDLVNIKPIK